MGTLASSISLLLLSSSLVLFCVSDHRLLPGASLLVNQTLVSAGEIFKLGFFSPGNSTARRYLGIWYNEIPVATVVWVANRENPFTDPSVVLRISDDSNLEVSNSVGSTLWSSNATGAVPTAEGVTVVLLDSGNLVLRAGRHRVLWQSFDHPTDTFLPGMKLWANITAGTVSLITSWKNADDPAPGDFSGGVDPETHLQLKIWKGREIYWRSNAWDRHLSTDIYRGGVTYLSAGEVGRTTLIPSPSVIRRFTIDSTGAAALFSWNNASHNWTVLWSSADDKMCEAYNACGPSGLCDNAGPSPACRCLSGYEPTVPSEWNRGVYSGGCAMRRAPTCDRRHGFVRMNNMKVPDKMVYLRDVPSEGDCEAACRSNCSCAAYSHVNATYVAGNTSRCLVWYGEFVDVVAHYVGGQDLYLRLLVADTAVKGKYSIRLVLILVVGVPLHIILAYFIWKNRIIIKDLWRWRRSEELVLYNFYSRKEEEEEEYPDLPLRSFECIVAVTNNFSDSNKLGEGGFGKVYKGILSTGQEIAIKRLSQGSGQGQEEFRNEVALIAKLQHRNLVRLLGSCVKGEERILLYEYLPNRSLDALLFDPMKKTQLDWPRRFSIIKGVARGLMYLHQDSRFKIVHRDLKASNILLDEDMNPKISDFGMARVFGGNQNQATTKRVVGTYGYMSPEYAMRGQFSIKSDIYSFGVLLLEIVSGQRNNCFYLNEVFLNLLSYAWQLREDDKVMEFLESSIAQTSSPVEIARCVHVGLLCVQDAVDERPPVSSVVFMLENHTAIPATPKRPMFMVERGQVEGELLKNSHSVNNLTITMIEGR